MKLPVLVAVSSLALAGCGDSGEQPGGHDPGGAPAGGNGSGANNDGAGPQGGAGEGGSGAGSQGGAPPCFADSLSDAVRVMSVTIEPSVGQRAITAQAGSGSVVAWVAADGVHITPLDAVDARAGDDLVLEGTQVYGVAASDSDVAVLIARAPDFMTFVRLDMAGVELARSDLVGGGDHGTIGVEWFGEFAQTGRMVGLPDGTYAAYHALHRRWPDNIGHQGDTLRLLGPDGAALGGGWGWGCSHSMDQRLAAGPSGELVPICIADCYPGKGIYFNHQSAMITPDPAANCAGGFTTQLGGLVVNAAGFWLVYQDDAGVGHLGLFEPDGLSGGGRVLGPGTGASRLASYAGGLLLGAPGPEGATTLTALDGNGEETGSSASTTAPLPEHDFESREDGEVAWASASDSVLTVVRVRLCE